MEDRKCLHCSEVALLNSDFCCFGCKTAYKVINSLKLNKYYDFCREIYGTTPDRVNQVKNKIDYMDFIKTSESEHSIQLIVEGIKCGSCIWLIENSLRQQDGIIQATVNGSSKVLSIVWIGEKSLIEKYITLIENIGYRAVPLVESEVVKSQLQLEKHYLKTIALAGVIWVQNMMISMGIWFDFSREIGINSRIFINISAAITTIPAIIYSSRGFFTTSLHAIKSRKSHMDIPISIAIILTLIVSIYGTAIGSRYVFYEAVSGLVFALLTGRYLELKVRNKANEYGRSLILNRSLFVTVMRKGELEFVNINSISIGDIIYVASGERVPLDGEITEGSSEVDNSIITGESLAQKVKKGDKIFAGAINLGDPIQFRVESDNENTVLAEIKRLITKSQEQKSQYQTFANKVASLYTPIVLILSIITSIIWFIISSPEAAILHGISLLVITCPCAMGLAVPIVHVIAMSNLMKRGIFVKTQDALERMTEVTAIALDKTGILTYGKAKFLNEEVVEHKSLLKSLAIYSKHHLCLSVVDSMKDVKFLDLENVTEEKGFGVMGFYNGLQVMIGRAAWCNVPKEEIEDNCLTTYFVVRKEGSLIESVQLRFSDKIREEGLDFVNNIKKNYRTFIISGDRKENVQLVAKELSIDKYYYELSPQDKYNIVTDGKDKVLMVGDGLNDAAAISAAHCSVSPANIVEISQNQSAVLFQNSLNDILYLLRVAKNSAKVAKENITISLIYNIISIPIAIAGYASPLMASIFMSLSSIFVILNSIRKMSAN
jgi:Cu2+-exporting ATPase